MNNLTRSRRHGRHAADQQHSSRSAGWSWFIVLGAVAVTAFVVMALIYALSGRDAGAWGLAAMFGGIVLSFAPAVAPMFGKQRPAPSAIPGPLSAKRAAFISIASFWAALYVLGISNAHRLVDFAELPPWTGFVAAIAAALPVAAVIYAAVRYLRKADEYQRQLLMRAALIAAGVTLFALTLWGLLELYVGATPIPLAMAFAPFCIAFAIANWWLRGRQ